MDESHEVRRESARHLLFLYSVICALSLETAMSRLIDPRADRVPIDLAVLPLTLAFIVTLVPFYHGALRHLDDYHMHSSGPRLRRGALLTDFVFLFLEGCILFSIAALTSTRGYFCGALIALLVVDVIWTTTTSTVCVVQGLTRRDVLHNGRAYYGELVRRRQVSSEPQLAWAFNNLLWIALLVVGLTVFEAVGGDGAVFQWIVLAIAIARTILDYRVSWKFYFPA